MKFFAASSLLAVALLADSAVAAVDSYISIQVGSGKTPIFTTKDSSATTAAGLGASGYADLTSFSLGSSASVGAIGATGLQTGKVAFEQVQITRKADAATARLYQAMWQGQTVQFQIRQVRAGAGAPSATTSTLWSFALSKITGVEDASSAGDDTTNETVTFAVGQMQIQYFSGGSATANGNVQSSAGWDAVKNTQLQANIALS